MTRTTSRPCKALFICDTPFATTKGMDGLLTSNAKKAQELLKEAGYDGTPVLLMHSTDLKTLTNLAPVAKSLMEKAGFKVDMQSMDWQTLVARRAKKDPPKAGGWNAFLTAWVAADVMNPISTAYVNAACDKASFGWPCDEKLEKLRDDFARADRSRQAEGNRRSGTASASSSSRPEIPVGEYVQPVAMRKNVKGFLMHRCRCSGTSKSRSDVTTTGGGSPPPVHFQGSALSCRCMATSSGDCSARSP